MSIVWLASYPRSGNTWMRFLLYGYFYGDPVSALTVEQTIPDMHNIDPDHTDKALRAAASDGMLFVKTHHYPNYRLPCRDITDAYVHISRNPKDVFLSAIRVKLGTAVESLTPGQIRAHGEDFIASLGSPGWHKLGYGAIVTHGLAWKDSGFRGAHITYEDMRRDTRSVLAEVVEFIAEEPADMGRVDQSVEWAGIDRMREMETNGHRFHIGMSPFIGDGTVNGTICDEYLDSMFDSVFGAPQHAGVT